MEVRTGADMLLAVRVSLDKIESMRNESFQKEEVQLFLNKSQSRLMDDLINKNFEQGTLRYEWLRPFMIEGAAIPLTWGVDDQSVLATFPVDVHYLIAAFGLVTVDAQPGTSFEGGCYEDIDDPTAITNPLSKKVQIEVNETGQVMDRQANAFYGSSAISPLAEAKGEGILVYRGKKFIINEVYLDYVLEPTLIDITSTVDTDWGPAANEKIVDLTVEYMRLSIEDPAYQLNVGDYNIRTQNA